MTIHTIAYSKVATCATQCDVFTLVYRDHPADCSHKYGTIGAFMDLKTIYACAYVEIRIFAADQPDVFARSHISNISHRDALVQKSDILWLI